jgi:hypothetical protein
MDAERIDTPQASARLIYEHRYPGGYEPDR